MIDYHTRTTRGDGIAQSRAWRSGRADAKPCRDGEDAPALRRGVRPPVHHDAGPRISEKMEKIFRDETRREGRGREESPPSPAGRPRDLALAPRCTGDEGRHEVGRQ